MSPQSAEECFVVLHIGSGPTRLEEQNGPALIVDNTDRFTLSSDIWIERLSQPLAINVQKACEPPHHGIQRVDGDRHLYAFVRRVPAIQATKHEGLQGLLAVVALSRLIHPTTTGTRYCAKIFSFHDPESPIEAIELRGTSPDIFVGKNPRNWLSVEDGKELGKLIPWMNQTMPARVHRAYWNHEYAMQSYYLDARWIFVVSGLEALISIGMTELSWQFRSRVRPLSEEFEIYLTDDDLRTAYALRSKLVHAESFLFGLETILPRNRHTELYEKLETVLRLTIRRCLVDESFSQFFESDSNLKARWPVSRKPKN